MTPLPLETSSEIRHGTIYGYNGQGCRCDACRDAKNVYAQRRGDNRRIGRRAEIKRAADYVPCPLCGVRCARGSQTCTDCRDRGRGFRDEMIAEFRCQGMTNVQIAAYLGLTPMNVASIICRLRKSGVDIAPSPHYIEGRAA